MNFKYPDNAARRNNPAHHRQPRLVESDETDARRGSSWNAGLLGDDQVHHRLKPGRKNGSTITFVQSISARVAIALDLNKRHMTRAWKVCLWKSAVTRFAKLLCVSNRASPREKALGDTVEAVMSPRDMTIAACRRRRVDGPGRHGDALIQSERDLRSIESVERQIMHTHVALNRCMAKADAALDLQQKAPPKRSFS